MIGVNVVENDVITEGTVKLQYFSPQIAVVSMEDRENKNTFSSQLTSGLLKIFSILASNEELRVVVIHGYDNYFCCGGTKQELLELSDCNRTFADFGFYRLLLDCPVPVIAAMQGHALGGGLAFGAFADLLVISEDSFYTTNFMNYGFTPGFGSTYFITKKFGFSIATSMLFGGQNFQGKQLKQWGVDATFAKRLEVVNTALNMAKIIAESSREKLIRLKQQLTKIDHIMLPRFIEQEIAMHKISFKLPEVKYKIEQLFRN